MEVESEPAATLEKAKAISSLSAETSHKICSDRVIGSIGVAVKELVENSLDAGATTITVRMKGYGLDLIEVSDNGKGVKESDFETLAKSFHTSKLNEFSDLDSIGTFGFRGEALSSLCRVCDGMEVVTRHESADSTVILKYNASGDLVTKSAAAGEITGTKVTLKKLFATLPVRRKIFQDKAQIEFSKALNLLNAYCIISDGVKFQVFHQVADGKESKKLAFTNGGSIKSNIGQILGHKLVLGLLTLQSDNSHPSFDVEGFISSCAHDSGRRVPDKQYFYLNKRPVDMPQISKSINQLYKQFNKNQFPIVVLHVKTKVTESVDVNLAPDKRSVIIKDQTSLQSMVQNILMKLFEDIPSAINLSSSISAKCKESNNFLDKFSQNSRRATGEETPAAKKPRFTVYESPSLKLDSYFVRVPKKQTRAEKSVVQPAHGGSYDIQLIAPSKTVESGEDEVMDLVVKKVTAPQEEKPKKFTPLFAADLGPAIESSSSMTLSLDDLLKVKTVEPMITEAAEVAVTGVKSEPTPVPGFSKEESKGTVEDKKTERTADEPSSLNETETVQDKAFTAGLDPTKGNLAEEEFKRMFRKEDFLRMKVIGQFNNGFLITRLDDDVFIIDQHASDEKFNFEKLCKNTKIKGQRLVLPMTLKLNVSQELVFSHHASVFRENGYDFNINDSASPGERIELIAVPSLLHATFGLNDVLDIIYQLQDSPYAEIKSKRVRSILASKACRFSIMVGTTMSEFGMRRLVENMGTMDQPWNCPHGRPTMRHLLNHPKISTQYSIEKAQKAKPNLAKLKSLGQM